MQTTKFVAFTMVALLSAGSAFACPKKNKDKSPADNAQEGVYEVSTEKSDAKKKDCPKAKRECPKKDKGDSAAEEEGVFEVADREGDEAKEGKREGKREGKEGKDGEREGKKRERRQPFGDMNLTDDQKEQVKEIMTAAREQAKALMTEIKAKKEAGEEVDRKAMHEKMMAIREGAMKNVYDNVLTAEQQAKADERREKMEERRKEREAKKGEGKKREGEGKKKKGDDDLDL